MNADLAWFDAAQAMPVDDRVIDVEGAAIHYLRWGDPGRPGVVLVHGGAAHAHWWMGVGPLLGSGYHVVALDLSGHGDSAHRPHYSAEQWAREVLAVAVDAGFVTPPLLVGHSMGGFVSIVAAAVHGPDLAGAIIVDSPVSRPDPESEEGASGRAFRNPKHYPTLDEAVTHFHLIPPQPVAYPVINDYVARRSLRDTAEGWTWKFDPRVFLRAEATPLHAYLADVRCRVAILRGALSPLVTPDIADYMSDLLGRNAPFVEIPEAHHHVLLDQPLALVAALRALLADWEHSIPRAPVKGRRWAPPESCPSALETPRASSITR